MKLSHIVSMGLTAVAAILLLAAMFVPWQGGAVFGFSVEPGLWNIQYVGFGESGSETYTETDPDAPQGLLIGARMMAVIALVGAIGAVAIRFIPGAQGENRPATLAAIAAGATVGALILFDLGIVAFFDDPDTREFLQLHTGSNLAISAAVFLAVAAAAHMWLDRVLNLQLVAAEDNAPEGGE